MMSELDLSGVDPLRWAEVRRRVDCVKSFLSIDDPTYEERLAHANSLGLSVNQFLALVRAWREHGRASAISGAGAARGRARASGFKHLPETVKTTARAVIRSLKPSASHAEAVRAVQAKCQSLGIEPPSRSTVWNMLMEARRERNGGEGEKHVIVGCCHVRLPVDGPNGLAFPQIEISARAADGAVIAAALFPEDRSIQALARATVDAAPGAALIIDDSMAAIFEAMPAPGRTFVKPTGARRALARALGRGIGSIELIYQHGRAIDPGRLLRARTDKPLSREDARRLLSEELNRHNAARGAAGPTIV